MAVVVVVGKCSATVAAVSAAVAELPATFVIAKAAVGSFSGRSAGWTLRSSG